MLLIILNRLSESLVTSSLAGAMIYTLFQRDFSGMARIAAFIISFVMGVSGADLTMGILNRYLPLSIQADRNIGAFVCGALVVTLTVRCIGYIEDLWVNKNRDVH